MDNLILIKEHKPKNSELEKAKSEIIDILKSIESVDTLIFATIDGDTLNRIMVGNAYKAAYLTDILKKKVYHQIGEYLKD